MRPDVGFLAGIGVGGYRKATPEFEYLRNERRLLNKHHTGRWRPNSPIIGPWYGQVFRRPTWVLAARYGHLTLHAICMSMMQSPKRLRFSDRLYGNAQLRLQQHPNAALPRVAHLPSPRRPLAICRIAALLTYEEIYTFQNPRPTLPRLSQAAT